MKSKLLYILALILTIELCVSLELDKQHESAHVTHTAELQQSIITLTNENNAAQGQIEGLETQVQCLQMELEREEEKVDRGGERLTSLGKYTITAYCGCKRCCGKYADDRPGGKVYGASGMELQEGVSVAAWLPFGTKLKVGDTVYMVQDRTAQWVREKYGGRIIDVYYGNHAEALAWGKREIEVFAVE